jgi:hypothetical protein
MNLLSSAGSFYTRIVVAASPHFLQQFSSFPGFDGMPLASVACIAIRMFLTTTTVLLASWPSSSVHFPFHWHFGTSRRYGPYHAHFLMISPERLHLSGPPFSPSSLTTGGIARVRSPRCGRPVRREPLGAVPRRVRGAGRPGLRPWSSRLEPG